MGRSIPIPATLKFDLTVPAGQTVEYKFADQGSFGFGRFYVGANIAGLGRRSVEIFASETNSDIDFDVSSVIDEGLNFSTKVQLIGSDLKLVFKNDEAKPAEVSVIQLS